MTSPKILLIDIETMPNICYAFNLYDYKKPDMIIKEKAIISFAYKWLGDKQTQAIWSKSPYNDKVLVKDIVKIISEADYVVGHYGDKFDMRFIRARALINGLTPPPPVATIDTYKLVKKYFHLNANRLDYLGKLLGFGGKFPVSWEIWQKCAEGDPKALETMVKYNKKDVELLEKVFLTILPHVESKLNHKLFMNKQDIACNHCGSFKLQRRGFLFNKLTKKQRYQCKECSSWSSYPYKEV